MVSYEDLLTATHNFSPANLIGSGSSGSVYKGNLTDGILVAIKVLDLNLYGAFKSFVAECEALRNVRHRNLIKLITSCSSIDYRNADFQALVYEYMCHGSLEEWIRGRRKHEDGSGLNVVERLNISIDVACAMEYLHHDCEAPVVHCDLKPSNVLLDEEMTAKVGDFGLARLLIENGGDQLSTTTNGLKGTIGYIPPGKQRAFIQSCSFSYAQYSFYIVKSTLIHNHTHYKHKHSHSNLRLSLSFSH